MSQQIKLCNTNDIEEQNSKGFEIGDVNLFAVKKDGQIFIYQNHCPHLGVELNWLEDQFLDSDNALIQCATHGALFLIESGECISGPCVGEVLKALPHTLNEAGDIFITL